jgi:hypothetical protein
MQSDRLEVIIAIEDQVSDFAMSDVVADQITLPTKPVRAYQTQLPSTAVHNHFDAERLFATNG